MAEHCCSKKSETLAQLAAKRDQRRVLALVMAINLAMFVLEFGGGLIARSSALMADSVDMLGDAFVYGLGLYALGRGARWQAGAAIAKGAIILVFGLAIGMEIVHKLLGGASPSSTLMSIFGGLALAANLACLALLWRFRAANVNMASTFECSRNDVISNLGVLVAAGLVALTGAGWPDIIVGAIVAALFLRSAVSVLRAGVSAWRKADPMPSEVLP